MAGIITKQFRLFYAEQFKELFLEDNSDSIYVFIGRPSPWPDDNFPPTPIDSISRVQYNIWNDIVSVKKISGADISFAAPRYDWVSGTVYNKYTANTAFHDGPFYAMNNEYQIYKCLENNKGGVSTVKPTGRLLTPFTTADGYKWKFMTEIPAPEAVKYITTTYMPVKKLAEDDGSYQWDVQAAAVNGSIDTVGVASGGAGYRYNTGTVAVANSTTLTLAVGANTINGAYTGSSIYINSGTGAGQLRKIVNYAGTARVATVNTAFTTTPSGSSTYILSPTISVSTGDGTGFKAYSVVANGSVDSVEVIAAGQDYSYANLAVTANTSTGGSGSTLVAQIAPYGGHGSDPVYEFFGHNIVMNITLVGSESGTFFANNEFRVIGLIANPLLANGSVATATSYMVSPQFTLTDQVTIFSADELLTGGNSGATAIFVEYANSSVITVTNVIGAFETTETITGNTSAATAVISSIAPSPFTKYTGRVMYMDNRAPITRNEQQEEDLRIILTL